MMAYCEPICLRTESGSDDFPGAVTRCSYPSPSPFPADAFLISPLPVEGAHQNLTWQVFTEQLLASSGQDRVRLAWGLSHKSQSLTSSIEGTLVDNRPG